MEFRLLRFFHLKNSKIDFFSQKLPLFLYESLEIGSVEVLSGVGVRFFELAFEKIFTRLSGLHNSEFKVYHENSFRMDPKRADNLEMRNGNAYPTLPLMEKPQAPYMDTP